MNKKKLILEEHITALLFLVMTALSGLNILSRVLVNFSFAFTEELIVYLFVIISMFGTAAGVVRGSHMGLSLLTDALKPPLKQISILFSASASILLFGILAWQGTGMILSQIKYGLRTPILQYPEWLFTLCLPVGSLFYIYRTVRKTITTLKGDS